MPSGVLAIDYEQQDYVLVVEHRWRETLTDVVTLDDMHQARRELAAMVVALSETILNEAIGGEYDVSGLVKWLRETGTPWFYEVTDVYFDVCARRDDAQPDKLERALAPVFARHGLPIEDDSGKILEDDQMQRTFRAFAVDLIQQHLKRRDGQPVPPEMADEILMWLGLQEPPAGSEPPQRFPEATKKVLVEMYGSEEAFGEAIKPLSVRIMGLYQFFLFGDPTHFDYAMEVPGLLVETNGEVLADNRTRWTFSAKEAYPSGYVMNCRSLEPRAAVVQEIFGKRVLSDRQTMLRFVELVRGNETVLGALRTCAAEKSAQPLLTVRDQTAPASPDTAVFDALIELLGAAPRG